MLRPQCIHSHWKQLKHITGRPPLPMSSQAYPKLACTPFFCFEHHCFHASSSSARACMRGSPAAHTSPDQPARRSEAPGVGDQRSAWPDQSVTTPPAPCTACMTMGLYSAHEWGSAKSELYSGIGVRVVWGDASCEIYHTSSAVMAVKHALL